MLCHTNVWSTGPELNMNTWCEFRLPENEFYKSSMPWVYADTSTLGVKHLLLPFFLIRLRGWARVAPDSMLTSAQRIHPGRVATSWQTKWMKPGDWFFKICVNTYVYIYISLYIYVLYLLYIHFLCISCPLLGQMNDQRYDFSMSISVREITSWCDLWFKWLKNKRSLMEWGYASMFAPRMGKISTP